MLSHSYWRKDIV